MKVFQHFPCLQCYLSKLKKRITSVGSGVKPFIPGYIVSADYIPVHKPLGSMGHSGGYFFRCCAIGMEHFVLASVKDAETFIVAIEYVRLDYLANKHVIHQFRVDDGSAENSTSVHDHCAQLTHTIKIIPA